MVKDSAAHYNAVFILPIVDVCGYFGYVGYHQFFNLSRKDSGRYIFYS
jgi:hypothetical protein